MKLKQHFLKFILIGFVLSFLFNSTRAANVTSLTSGNWSASAWPNTTRTGTITVGNGSTSVTGAGTLFTSQISIGNIIKTTGNVVIGTVASIADDTHLTLVSGAPAARTAIAYNSQGVGSGDAVTIANAASIIMDVDGSCSSLVIAAGANSTTLTINGSNTLIVSGTVTINAGTGSGDNKIIAVGSGSLNCSSITMASTGNSNRDCIVRLSSGTVTVTGNVVMNGSASQNQVTFTGSGTLNIGGNLSGGDVISSTGIINFNGSSAQTTQGYTFYTLKANNVSGVKLTSAATVTTLTIGDEVPNSLFDDGGYQVTSTGTLNLTSGTFTIGGTIATTFPGFTTRNINAGTTVVFDATAVQNVPTTPAYSNLTLSGASKTLAAGTLNVSGDLIINTGATYNGNTNNPALNIAGNFSNSGTFTQGTGLVTFNGTSAQSIGGSSSTAFNNVTVSNTTSELIVNSNFSVSGTLTVNNGAVISPAAAVVISGVGTMTGTGTVKVTRTSATPDFISQYSITNKTLTDLTVEYIGAGNQTVSAVNYGNLTISANGTRTVTLASTGTIGISGIFSPTQTNTLYTVTGSTVDYNGSGNQQVKTFVYNNLNVSTGNTKQLDGPITINSNLSIGTATILDVTISNYDINIGGNWINNGGTFNCGNGSVTFNGTGSQAVQGTAASQTFYNMAISKISGTISVPVGSTTSLTINDLTVNQGTLQINDATNVKRTITINGNLTVQSSGSIITGTGNPNTTGYTLPGNIPPVGQYHSIFHELIIKGNFTNNGSVRFTNLTAPAYGSFATNGAVTVRFTGMSDNTATLNGRTDFYNLIIDKGNDKTYTLTVNSSGTANFSLFGPLLLGRAETTPFTADNPEVRKSLFIKNGTLKLTGTIMIPTLSEGDGANGNGDYAIGGNAMLWIAGPNVTVYTTATSNTGFPQAPTGATGVLTTNSYQAISVYGTFRISDGFFGTRNSAGFIFWDTPNSTAEVIFEGGLVNTSVFREGVAAGKASYRQTGGTVIVRGDETESGELASYAVFDISNSSSSFIMSGGDLIFRDRNTGGTTGGNGFYVNASPGNYSVTGGTITFETNPANTPSIDIYSTVNFWNLNIKRLPSTSGKSTVNLLTGLVVSNNLTIDANAELSAGTGNFPVTVAGNFTINSGGTYTPGTNTTTFNGGGNYYLWNDGSITNGLYNLVSNKTLGTLIFAGTNSDFNVLNDLTVVRDTLADGGKNIFVKGNVINNGICQGAGKISLNKTNGVQTISGNGAGKFRNLELVNTNGIAGSVQVSLATDITITGNLILSNDRIFDISSYLLTFDKLGTVVGTTGNSRFIKTAGAVSNGGMKKIFNDTIAFVYPIGTGTNFTPATVRIDKTPSSYGAVTVKPVSSQHPLLTDPSGFNYYWKVEESGFTGIQTGSVRLIFNYGNLTDSPTYIPGKYYPPSWTYTNDVTLVDETNNLIWFFSNNSFGGDYTAGIPACFGASVSYYSRANGDWNSPSTWSTVAFGGAAATTIPTANNPVFIGDGATNNHTITVAAGNAVAGSLTLKQGSILDLGTASGNNFGSVLSGSDGTLKISSNSSIAVFPAGDFGSFLGASGGTVEYYTTGTQNFTLPVVSAAPSSFPVANYNNLKLSPETGRQITMPNIDLTVFGNVTVSGNSATGLVGLNGISTKTIDIKNNLNITGGNLFFQNNTAQMAIVEKSIVISSGAIFNVSSLGTAVNNVLKIGGNLSNNGTFDMSVGSNRLCNVIFNGETDASISGSGGTTDFYAISVEKGSSMSPLLDVTSTSFTFSNNTAPLSLSYGTFRLTSPLSVTLSAMGLSIPATACLSTNGGTILLSTAADDLADVDLAGKIEVKSGSISVGNQANNNNNDIVYAGTGTPTIDVQGGNLFVNGQIRRNISSGTGSLIYRQSGSGSVTINGRNLLATRAKLEVLNTGSIFEMSSSSSLTIVRGGGTSFNDLYIVPAASNVTGGTIVFGNSSTEVANQNFTLNSSVALNNITIDGTTNPKNLSLSINNLTILGNLLINATSSFNSNGLDLTIGGNLTNLNTGTGTGLTTGGFRPGSLTQTTTFNSSGTSQLITGVAGNLTNFANLVINNTNFGGAVTLSANTALRVNSDLTLSNGTISDGGNIISVVGNISNSSIHSGTGRIDLVGAGVQILSGNGTGKFGNIKLNPSYDVQMTASQEITGVLTFNTKMLDIGSNLLKLSNISASATSGSSATSYIRLNGLVADQGVQKSYPASALDYTFPIGVVGKYTPARLNVTSNTALGAITIVPVNSKHPGTTNALDKQLNYYWNVKKTGFSALTVSHTYSYVSGDVTGNESLYDAGHYFSANWDYGSFTSISTSLHTANFTAVNYIDGDFTAGETSEFGVVMIFYSRNATLGGNWNDVNTWSTESHSGVAASSYPNGQPVVIASGHTVLANGSFRNAYSVVLEGTLDLAANTGHDLGTVTGTGTLKMSPAISGNFVFPVGDYSLFNSGGGGTIELYNTTGTAMFPSPVVYNNLVLTGNGTKQMANADIVINGNLSNGTGSTFTASGSNKIILTGNWINNGTFIHNNGNIEFDGTTTLSGSSVTTFNNITINSGKSLTGPLSSTFNVAGNWINNGTFSHNAGNVIFSGSSIISGTSVTTFNNIIINSTKSMTGKLNDNLIVQGNWSNNGSFIHNGGTVSFDGTSSISGSSVTTFGNLVINSSRTLNAPLSGTMDIVLNFTNNGTFNHNDGKIVFTGSTQSIGGTSPTLFNNLEITSGSTTSMVTSGLVLKGIILCNGTLNSNGNLTLLSTSSQTSLVDGAGTGEINGNLTMQRYLPTGFGYKYFSSPFQEATVGQFSAYVNLASSFATVYKYDENRLSSGWIAYTNSSGRLDPMHSYAVNFGTSTSPVTVSLTGVVNNRTLQPLTLTNNDKPFTTGFNLVGNPYPSPIDWDAVSGWTKTNIDNAVYYFNASSLGPDAGANDSLQYQGTYSSYINGISSDGSANNIIPAMQGFFVHVSTIHPTDATLIFNNGIRVNSLNPLFKSADLNTRPLLRLVAGFGRSDVSGDPAVIYFNDLSTLSFDTEQDALKLMNLDTRIPNLYIISKDAKKLSIDAIPSPLDTVTRIPLGIKTEIKGIVNFKVKNLLNIPSDMNVYLEDAVNHTCQDLKLYPEYRTQLNSGVHENRFSLIFSYSPLAKPLPIVEAEKFTMTPAGGGSWTVNINQTENQKQVFQMVNMQGQVLFRKEIFGSETIDIGEPPSSGIYIISLISGKKIFSKKIVIQKR